MPGPEVTKKVNLLGFWTEDVFSDEIVKIISARAKTEKGKKIKVILNESGLKLTRSRFFLENKTTFFPIKDLKAVTCSPEVSLCVLFILADSERKYKIVALRCSSQADSVQLINFSAEIQRNKQADVELRQKAGGNWTLRDKRPQPSGRRVTDVWSDHKPNGEIPVKINGSVVHQPETHLQKPNRHETYGFETSWQEAHWQETQRPETERPETQRPETHRLGIHRPETHRPETQRPEKDTPDAQWQKAGRSDKHWQVIHQQETYGPESKALWQVKNRPEIYKRETQLSETQWSEPHRPEPYRLDPRRLETYRQEPHRTETHRPETYRQDTYTPEIHSAETRRTETHRPETYRQDTYRPEIHSAETHRPETYRPDIHSAETRRTETRTHDQYKPEPQRPEPVLIAAPTGPIFQKSVYTKRQNRGSNGSKKSQRKKIDVKDTPNGYTIETEVSVRQNSPDRFLTIQNNDQMRMAKTASQLYPSNASIKRQYNTDQGYVIETDIVPYQHSPKQIHSRKSNEDVVLIKANPRHMTWNGRPEGRRRQEDVVQAYVIGGKNTQHQPSPTQSGRYQAPTRTNSKEAKKVIARVVHTSAVDHIQDSRHQDFSRPQVYSGKYIIPSRSVVYATSYRPPLTAQPVIYREPPRAYEARHDPAVVFYRSPWVHHGRTSPQSDLAPMKMQGDTKKGKIDQRSLRSNTSKDSRKKKSNFHFPTTIVRSIENTYPRRRPFLVRSDQIMSVVPRNSPYSVVETSEPQMYPDDGTPI